MGISEQFCIHVVRVQSLGLCYRKSNFRCLQRNMLHIRRDVVAFESKWMLQRFAHDILKQGLVYELRRCTFRH